jgi:hypothetical protein
VRVDAAERAHPDADAVGARRRAKRPVRGLYEETKRASRVARAAAWAKALASEPLPRERRGGRALRSAETLPSTPPSAAGQETRGDDEHSPDLLRARSLHPVILAQARRFPALTVRVAALAVSRAAW